MNCLFSRFNYPFKYGSRLKYVVEGVKYHSQTYGYLC